jgi:hypothetical protein
MNPIRLAVGIAAALFIVVLIVHMVGGSKTPDARNRVPNFSVNGQELADLKQQLADTKAAAQQAQQAAQDATKAKNDMQAQLEQLAKDAKQPDNKPAAAPTTDEPKEGRQEMTRPGIITDFGMYNAVDSNVIDNYIGFNFTDRYGFTKRFFPVCPGQTVKTGVPISIIYHWRSWQENQEGKRGCFQIDGFQVQ